MITIDDFKKIEIKIGEILSAKKVEGADKLLKLSVDFDEETPRQVLSGIAEYRDPTALIGKKFPFVTNLEPRTIRGLESQAMILAASVTSAASDDFPNGERQLSLLTPDVDIKKGSRVG